MVMMVMVVKVVVGGGGGDECLHHPWLSNSPSSELSNTDVAQSNCGAFEQRVTFTLIVAKLRWRLFRAAMWLEGGKCT